MSFFEHIRIGDIAALQEMLTQNPALLEETDPRGYPPIVLAAYTGNFAVTEFLIQQGVNINAVDAAGNTALMGVCFKGFTRVAQLLLENGASDCLRTYRHY